MGHAEPAIMRYAERKAERIALEARIEEMVRLDNSGVLDDSDLFHGYYMQRLEDLKSQLQELGNE